MKMGLCSVVFVVLLILKLCGLVVISWWWVFSPLLFVLAFWCFLLPLIFIGVFMFKLVKEFSKNGRV
jgi:hypothetical protein